MMRATKIPIVEIRSTEHVCFRCGIVWQDSRYKYVDRAPCKDCRAFLTTDGEDVIALYVRPNRQAEAYAGLAKRVARAKTIQRNVAA